MSDLAEIKHRHNIVDIIGQYVAIKKQGKEYFGCCPFHGEKTPSFTVNEPKQFYHCFGCGAHGDVIRFLQEYSGLEFVEACKMLGAESEVMPSEKVKRNLQKAKNAPRFQTPCDDKRDPELCAEIMSECSYVGVKPIHYFESCEGDKYVKVIDWQGETVNLFDGFDFIAGGISYGAFTPIKVKENKNFMLCVDTKDAIEISEKYKVNMLICYAPHNLKYVAKNAPKAVNVLPIITNQDDDFLCFECEWLSYRDGELKKEKAKNV